METLLTTLAFFALTAFFIWRHMRAGEGGSGASSAATRAVKVAPCARCNASIPAGSTFCPGCGIPVQIFEVVTARVSNSTASDDGTAPPRAAVRADMCVGCATCVAACPETGALTMRGKLAVVDDALCQGHGDCVAACPVGAISVNAGKAINRVRVPLIDANFETNVPGIHVVGELGGRGLIKNAINEGKIAAEHVARVLPPGEVRADGDERTLDVVIVGSGPAGLSAGLEAHRRKLSYVVLEQGSLSDTVRKYPRHKVLFAEPLSIPLYGDLWIADASKEALLQVWETIVANTGLDVQTGQKVENIIRDGAVFRVETTKASYHARRIILAMGRRGTPRKLGVMGEELDKVFYDIVEMEAFAGKRVLVVGGGDSAIESALGLANQKGTEVILSYRGESFSRVKERNVEKITTAIKSGRVKTLFKSEVREIRSDRVSLMVEGEPTIMPNDFVFVRIGGEAPYTFLERLGVSIVQKEVPLVPSEPARAG